MHVWVTRAMHLYSVGITHCRTYRLTRDRTSSRKNIVNLVRICVCACVRMCAHVSTHEGRESSLISARYGGPRVIRERVHLCADTYLHAYAHVYTHTRTRKGICVLSFFLHKTKEYIATVVSCLSLNWSVFLFLIFILPSSAWRCFYMLADNTFVRFATCQLTPAKYCRLKLGKKKTVPMQIIKTNVNNTHNRPMPPHACAEIRKQCICHHRYDRRNDTTKYV